jgi:hypothetical protein
MIKHETIPKHFKHRYLLADLGLGWGAMDPIEGALFFFDVFKGRRGKGKTPC